MKIDIEGKDEMFASQYLRDNCAGCENRSKTTLKGKGRGSSGQIYICSEKTAKEVIDIFGLSIGSCDQSVIHGNLKYNSANGQENRK